MKKLCIIALLLLLPVLASAQYSLFVGEAEYLEVPDAPMNGWVTHAWWESSSAYIGFSEQNEYGAIIEIRHYYTGTVSVTVTYAYSYYDSKYNTHVGHSSKTYYIECKAIPVSLDENEITLKVGKTKTLSTSYPSSYAGWMTGVSYIWNTSNEDVATVSKEGLVKAYSVGKARITLDPVVGPPQYCDVTVVADPPRSIRMVPESLTIVEGKTASFSCEWEPADAYAEVQWSSSAENVAVVSNRGVVKAVSEGQATITVTTDNGLSAKGTVEVIPLPKKVTLEKNLRIAHGYSWILTPSIEPAKAVAELSWQSSHPAIATVDNSGRVTAKAPGEATITVMTGNGISAECVITVYVPEAGLESRNIVERIRYIGSLRKESAQ